MFATQTPPSPIFSGVFAALGLAILTSWFWLIDRWRRGEPVLPWIKPRRVPWGLGSVLMVLLLQQLIGAVLMRVYLQSSRPGGAGPTDLDAIEMMGLMGTIDYAVLVLVPLLLRGTSGARLADLGLGPVHSLREVGRGLVVCLLALPVVYGVGALAFQVWPASEHPAETMIREVEAPRALVALIAVVSAVVVAPAAEELLFRGVVQGWLTTLWGRRSAGSSGSPGDSTEAAGALGLDLLDEVGPPRPGLPLAEMMPNLLTSALFAAFHAQQWPAPVPLFLLSLALGTLYRRTGSLVGPITLHAAFNGLSTLMLFLKVRS